MARTLKNWFITICSAGILLVGIAGKGQAKVLNLGDPSPIFVLESIEGKEFDVADFVGTKIIVLGLFHICDPCMKQAMELQALLDSDRKGDILVVGINSTGDSKKKVLDYLNAFPQKISYPYLLDPSRTVEGLFSIRATPIVYIIDLNGKVQFKGSSVPARILEEKLLRIRESH